MTTYTSISQEEAAHELSKLEKNNKNIDKNNKNIDKNITIILTEIEKIITHSK
tara:strand:+ start:187 stop:345 length:159 start_codon:yes stop_codon:yes gene_type:complete